MCQHFIAPLLRCRVSILKTAVSILTWQGEVLWSRMWFSQSKACPLHCECVDLCDFLKCGKLDCIICGSGGLRVRFPLATMVSIIELSSKVVWGFPGDSQYSCNVRNPRRVSLEKEIAPHSSTLAWLNPMDGRKSIVDYSPWVRKK